MSTADELENAAVPDIQIGTYEHYSGKRYEVIGLALHSETLEPMIVYKPLYKTKGPLWARPYAMFLEEVTVDGKRLPRFRKVDELA